MSKSIYITPGLTVPVFGFRNIHDVSIVGVVVVVVSAGLFVPIPCSADVSNPRFTTIKVFLGASSSIQWGF